MIRFRTAEDEARYVALRTEMWLRLVNGMKHDPVALQEVLRNYGKLESFIHYEGVAQGVHAAVLTECDGTDPFGAHRDAYGMSDTPLSAKEKGLFPTTPLEFAPTTLAEARAALAVAPVAVAPVEVAAPEPELSVDPAALEEEPEYDEELKDIIARFASRSEENEPLTSPDLLDRIRSELMGSKFDSWDEMIMALHIRMHMDAATLDMQLMTQEGLAVLDQCNIFVRPGLTFNPTAIEFKASLTADARTE